MRSFLNLFICLVSFIVNAQVATNESNNIKLKEIQERQKEIQIQKTSDSLDEISKNQNGDSFKATQDVETASMSKRFGEETTSMGISKDTQVNPGLSNNVVNRSWLGKLGDSLPPYFFVFIILGILILGIFIGNKRD